MIFFAVGNDFEARNKQVHTWLQSMQSKRPDAELITIDNDSNTIIQQLSQQVHGVGLFDEKSIVKLNGVCEIKEVRDFVFSSLDEYHQSPNAFIFNEQSLGKKEINQLKNHQITISEHSKILKEKNHNLFYLGDLLLSKNKSKLWLAIQEEIQQGASIEELFGIIMWQVKSLHIAKSHNQTKSGLKPFVYNKCIRSSWTTQESQNLHKKLVTIYHQSRREGLNLTEQTELIILEL